MANNTEITNGTTNAKTLAPANVWFELIIDSCPNCADIVIETYTELDNVMDAFNRARKECQNEDGATITVRECKGTKDRFTTNVVRIWRCNVFPRMVIFRATVTNEGVLRDLIGSLNHTIEQFAGHIEDPAVCDRLLNEGEMFQREHRLNNQ